MTTPLHRASEPLYMSDSRRRLGASGPCELVSSVALRSADVVGLHRVPSALCQEGVVLVGEAVLGMESGEKQCSHGGAADLILRVPRRFGLSGGQMYRRG